jgi:hypothetical protein
MGQRISDSATFEKLQDLLLKLSRRMRTMAPSSHVSKDLDLIEARVELMMARGKGKLRLI